MKTLRHLILLCLTGPLSHAADGQAGFTDLFPRNGIPTDWDVRAWNDVSIPITTNSVWIVKEGILYGGAPRGSWLMSKREYGDFTLEFEFKLGERGNSGCAIRSPLKGDPAFDGMEIQMADFRYNPEAKDSELTGGIYRAIAPKKQVYQPTQWNRYRITVQAEQLTIVLNGELIQDVNLSKQETPVSRHDGTPAPAIKNRPRRGHIGFQELSRDGGRVEIRNARIKELN